MLETKEDLKTDNEGSFMEILDRKDLAVPALQWTLTCFTIFYLVMGIAMVCGALWGILELQKYVDLPSDMSGNAPYLLMGLGVFTLIISSFAFSCIYREQTLLIYIYAGCLACVFVINIGLMVSVVCYKNALYKGLFDGLTRTIHNYNPDTTNFDFAQSTFQCCGVTNYTDWIKSSPTKVIPTSCCVDPTNCVTANYGDVYTKFQCCGVTNYTDWIKSSPTKVIPTSCCVDPTNCVTANYGDVYTKGCYALIKEYIERNMPTITVATGGLSTMPVIGSQIAFALAQYTSHSKMYTDAQYAAYFT
ncbi:Tetraspanin-7 [Papilio machaon]|uniref:Tetraspanin n=1 Tax=Papilio machaon TaxID=76193 RepID=A0A194QSB2_PAPMA|nr:Tetraspanin-7 [Papilio machaon]